MSHLPTINKDFTINPSNYISQTILTFVSEKQILQSDERGLYNITIKLLFSNCYRIPKTRLFMNNVLPACTEILDLLVNVLSLDMVICALLPILLQE